LAVIAVSDAGALLKKAKECTQVAIVQLTMALITEAAMTFIYEGMTDTDWPSGLAYLVVTALKTKYMPRRYHLQGGATQDYEQHQDEEEYIYQLNCSTRSRQSRFGMKGQAMQLMRMSSSP
jgi:hypothetical protein